MCLDSASLRVSYYSLTYELGLGWSSLFPKIISCPIKAPLRFLVGKQCFHFLHRIRRVFAVASLPFPRNLTPKLNFIVLVTKPVMSLALAKLSKLLKV
jgi:hypothetical protein